MAEVIRAGIESIPRGQFEAADAQGFDYTQKMAYIILPQTVKVILPPTVNQIGNLIKNTAVLYIIGGADLISSTYNFVTGANTGGFLRTGLHCVRGPVLHHLLPPCLLWQAAGKPS